MCHCGFRPLKSYTPLVGDCLHNPQQPLEASCQPIWIDWKDQLGSPTMEHLFRSCSYTPLPDGPFIRLLRVQPAARFSDPLICTTSSISLDDFKVTNYVALSYTWGDQTKRNPITCDGYEVDIGSNLKHALLRFRQLDNWEFIWADAICINQADNNEKSVQIPLMRRIYHQAAMTYVYLGEQEDQPITPNAVEALEKWVLQPARSLGDQSIPVSKLISFLHHHKDQNLGDLLDQILESSPLPKARDFSAWMAWQILLARPWFNRIWVIQEATASEHTVFQIGSTRISRDQLMAANIASFKHLSESSVNLGFSIYGGYSVAGQKLDAIDAISRWKANRVNLEIMREIGAMIGRDGFEETFGRGLKYRRLSPIDTSRFYDLDTDPPRSSDSSSGSTPISLPEKQDSSGLDTMDDLVNENESEDSSTTSSAHHDAQLSREDEQLPDSDSSGEHTSEGTGQEDSESSTADVVSPQERYVGSRSRYRRRRSQHLNGKRKRAVSADTESGDDPGTVDEWTARFQQTERIRSRHLFQLVKKCCKFESSMPRDRLYGLLGIASDCESLPRPDYSKTDQDVYRQFAEYFIEQGYGIELLSTMGSAGSPSWVPNFAAIGENVPGHADGWSQRHFLKFQAGGPNPGEARLEGDKLLVRGFVLDDEVQLLGPQLRPPVYFSKTCANGESERDWPYWGDQEEGLKKWERHVVEWDEESVQFLQKACSAGRLGDDRSLASIMQLYNITISAGNEKIHQHKNNSIVAEFGLSEYSIADYPTRHARVVREHRDWVIDTVQGRRICVTREGQIGLVPAATEPGDVLCVFLGASAPFVARKRGGDVVLLGDSYVHSMMKGQWFMHENNALVRDISIV